ncbi:MAG: hypothetical protein JWP13_762 [Candidatus Saccharibacteria bacterium]|nr:hypothetical protein [Candidatus Saccharibacteria bacterium]
MIVLLCGTIQTMPERRFSFSFLIISTLLTIALGGWVITSALTRTVGQPEQAKDLLNKSGLYQAIIPQQVADAQKANPSLSGIPLDNPEIQKILATSLDTQKLQNEGDKAVDAVYAWLEGKSGEPRIDISVMADQESLAQAAGDYAAKHAASLPACGPGEADYAAFADNPLSATCLPVGISPEIVQSNVEQAVANNPALGTSTQLTENDLKLANGKTIMESFNSAPVWYQRARLLPLIFITIAAICVVLLLLILKTEQGVRSAGKHFLSVGITFALVAIALAWGLEKLFSTFIPKSDNPNVGDALMKLSTLFNAALRDNMVLVSLYLVAAGAIFLICALLLRRMKRSTAGTTTPEAPTDTRTPAPPKTTFVPAAKPATKKPAKAAPKKKPATHKKKKVE